MTNSDYLTSLGKQWQQAGKTPTISIADAKRRQQLLQAYVIAELLVAIMTAGLAYYFWSRGRGLIFNVSGAVLFMSAVYALISNHRISRPVLSWEDWSPQGLIEYQKQSCVAALNKSHHVVFSCLVLLLFVVFIWTAGRFESVAMPAGFALFYTVITLPVVVVLLAWSRWRITNKSIELETYARLLQEFKAVDESR